jgi:hypothetical protein
VFNGEKWANRCCKALHQQRREFGNLNIEKGKRKNKKKILNLLILKFIFLLRCSKRVFLHRKQFVNLDIEGKKKQFFELCTFELIFVSSRLGSLTLDTNPDSF